MSRRAGVFLFIFGLFRKIFFGAGIQIYNLWNTRQPPNNHLTIYGSVTQATNKMIKIWQKLRWIFFHGSKSEKFQQFFEHFKLNVQIWQL